MKAKELAKKSKDELAKLLSVRREDLRKFRFDLSGSRIKNLRDGRNIRKDIARILTIIRNKKES